MYIVSKELPQILNHPYVEEQRCSLSNGELQ